MRMILTIFMVTLAACSPPPPSAEKDPTLVTVFSATGPDVAPRDGLFASYGIGVGSRAHFLDAQALASLPARTLDADFPVGSDIRRFSGPRLSDLLDTVAFSGQDVRLTAADGYQVVIPGDMIARFQPIFATHVDGQPLALGSLGPAILVWPRQSDDRLADMNDDLWVWGVFAIEMIETEDL